MSILSADLDPIPKADFWRRHQKRIAPWLFLAPGIFMFALYVIYPIVESVIISFYRWDGIGEPVHVGLENYDRLLYDEIFHTALVNNVLWLVLYMLALPIGLSIALFLNQRVFGIRLIKSMFFFPFVISQVVVGLVFTWFYDPNFGLLGEITQMFGFEPIAILANEDYVTYGIIVAGLWPQIAYCMILYLTGLNNVNPELIEAGRIDGAKGWSMLWNVILPQLRPATFIAIVVTVIGALRSFDFIAIMTRGGPWDSSQVLAHYMYERALSEFGYEMGYGASIATVLFAIMMVFISIFIVHMYTQEKRG